MQTSFTDTVVGSQMRTWKTAMQQLLTWGTTTRCLKQF